MANFVDIMHIMQRMCKCYESCADCIFHDVLNKSAFVYCEQYLMNHPKEAEEILMNWAEEHPVKTNADKFREVFGVDIMRSDKGCVAINYSCQKSCAECPYYHFWTKEYKEPGENK